MIKLCFKEYESKMSLEAIKQFKLNTGLDLWCTLISFIQTYRDTSDLDTISRMQQLYSVCDFETGAQMFHALIHTSDSSIPLQEIEDSMFRVGWMPTKDDGNLREPWPIVAVNVAYDIDKQFQEILPKKKAVI